MNKPHLSPRIGGYQLKNAITLAALTNQQSKEDGELSEDEKVWLEARARGGFSMVHTCACLVAEAGKGFKGQLGIYHDRHIPRLSELAKSISKHGALGIVQLHDAGFRTPSEYAVNGLRTASEHPDSGARAMSNEEVYEAIDSFVEAAVRAEKAGFEGVQIHGAHGYLIAQFLSADINHRSDEFGGSLANRQRFLNEVIKGIRAKTQPEFVVGVRLSAERFGVTPDDMLQVIADLNQANDIDYLDISLWDVRTTDDEGEYLIDRFCRAKSPNIPMGVAGKIHSGQDIRWCYEHGADFVLLGRGGILHHDFPKKLAADNDFNQQKLPVSKDYLKREFLGDAFISYMSRWEGFVEDV